MAVGPTMLPAGSSPAPAQRPEGAEVRMHRPALCRPTLHVNSHALVRWARTHPAPREPSLGTRAAPLCAGSECACSRGCTGATASRAPRVKQGQAARADHRPLQPTTGVPVAAQPPLAAGEGRGIPGESSAAQLSLLRRGRLAAFAGLCPCKMSSLHTASVSPPAQQEAEALACGGRAPRLGAGVFRPMSSALPAWAGLWQGSPSRDCGLPPGLPDPPAVLAQSPAAPPPAWSLGHRRGPLACSLRRLAPASPAAGVPDTRRPAQLQPVRRCVCPPGPAASPPTQGHDSTCLSADNEDPTG